MFQCSIRVAFLGALVLCAGWGLGQTANVYDLPVTDQLTVNTCSMGEPVTLNGTIHFSYSVTTDSTGVNHFAITAANQLTGVGKNSGLPYVADESDEYDSNNDDPSADVTVELKSDLKPQSGGAGVTLVQSLHIVVDTTGNISAQVVSNATSCGS